MATYTIPYEVPATTFLDAIFAAGALLRTGVRVTEVLSAKPTVPGWWEVKLAVEEDEPESADPITAAKAEAER
ncbi:MAG TPA: hypothetical protein VNN79_22100 [Actinomycetota bacterium]|nr:hypothetical protein [Actinomycetota bacterium]